MEEISGKRLDFNDFKEKLGSWSTKLKPFIESEEMWNIYEKIKKDASVVRIVPNSDDTFRAFLTTNIHQVKVIFLLQDPYPKLYSNGIAMDCSNDPDKNMHPSLNRWYDSMTRDLGQNVNRTKNLEYLHKQGVMLLNTDLTCKLNISGSHDGLWEPFMAYLLKEVLGQDTHIIYVICGKPSARLENYISNFCTIFELEHPIEGFSDNREWSHFGIFNKINKMLRDHNSNEIIWDYNDYLESKSPF